MKNHEIKPTPKYRHRGANEYWRAVEEEARSIEGLAIEDITDLIIKVRESQLSTEQVSSSTAANRKFQVDVRNAIFRHDGQIYGLLKKILSVCTPMQLRQVKKQCNHYLRCLKQPPSAYECTRKGQGDIIFGTSVRHKRFQIEWRFCGKDCNGCPHGPYLFAYWREANSVREDYLKRNVHRLPPSIRKVFREHLLSTGPIRQLKLKGCSYPSLRMKHLADRPAGAPQMPPTGELKARRRGRPRKEHSH